MFFLKVHGQSKDSVHAQALESVSITSDKYGQFSAPLTLAGTVVSAAQIRMMGSLRLNEVLSEQTGLVMTPNAFGVGLGLQMQGADTPYTLILLDGEPLIGQNSGALDLGRYAIANVKQVEIIKGPSSSLFGSDALAGIVNIISNKADNNTAGFNVRYGTNNTLDLNVNAGLAGKRYNVNLFFDRYATDGYDLTPESVEKTISPFINYTGQARLSYQFHPKVKLLAQGRAFRENQTFSTEVLALDGVKRTVSGESIISDYNFNPVLTYQIHDKIKLTGRYYLADYATSTAQPNGSETGFTDQFMQRFMRTETVGEFFFNENNILTQGLGILNESVKSSRYIDEERYRQNTLYAFSQYENHSIKNTYIIAGLRYDRNSVYGQQLSPKLSLRYDATPTLAIKASVGVGFKAPDFRQLYLNFNNRAVGYALLGTEVVHDIIEDLSQKGMIVSLSMPPEQKLAAESSSAINVGLQIIPRKKIPAMEINFFYNDIRNKIEPFIAAQTSTPQSIFSYRNLNHIYTYGLEYNATIAPLKNLKVMLGYQLLYAIDRDVVKNIKANNAYYRDPETKQTKRLRRSEYYGLYNRSRHHVNVKLFYTHPKTNINVSLRMIYLGTFGAGAMQGNIQGGDSKPADANGNGILDVYDYFVPGYALWNFSIAKRINKIGLTVQTGIDNLTDYKNAIYVPSLSGRIFYAGLRYTFEPQKK